LFTTGESIVSHESVIDDILRREGGYVDHPADRGGPTKYGVTLATLADWRVRQTTVDDVRKLTEVEAREIYRERYIIEPRLHKVIDPKVRALAVDCAVNHGPKQAVKLLQLAARVFPDGDLGPKTEGAVSRMESTALYRRLCAARVRYYGQIITKDPSQSVFAAGWTNRVAEFIEDVT
jgi:lysozyme family protein